MNKDTIENKQGHWLLAKMGKKVLRPGGRELTEKLIEHLDIRAEDEVVEFAAELGVTAALALKNNPKSYTGVEIDRAVAEHLRAQLSGAHQRVMVEHVLETNLPDACCTRVFAEAMLTMQSALTKQKTINEAKRILKVGGLYGIHELGLTPDDLPDADKARIQKDLAQVIKVNARPLTAHEWSELLEKAGFEIVNVSTSPMYLLEPKRMIADEGILRTLKIVFNILTHPHARKRILAMRKVFRQYQEHLNAVSIVARKRDGM